MKSKLIKRFLGWSLPARIGTIAGIVAIISFVFFTPFFNGYSIYGKLFYSEDIQDSTPNLFIKNIRWNWEEDTLIFLVTYKNGGTEKIEMTESEIEYIGDMTITKGPIQIPAGEMFTTKINIKNKKSEPEHILRLKVYYKNLFEKNAQNYCFQTFFKYDDNPGKLAAIINQTICD